MRRITLVAASSVTAGLLIACSGSGVTHTVINAELVEQHHIETAQEIGNCTVMDPTEGCAAEATIEAIATVETVDGISEEEVAEALDISLESQLPSGIICNSPDHEVQGGVLQVFPTGALWSYQIRTTTADGDESVSDTLHAFVPEANSVACGMEEDLTD